MTKPVCVYDGVYDPLISAPTHNHSDDLLAVFCGRPEPVMICGYHESRFSVPGSNDSPLNSDRTSRIERPESSAQVSDLIQFARLLDEIRATQDDLDLDALCVSMDCEEDVIDDIFERATEVWELAKANRVFQQNGVFHEPIPDDFQVRPIPSTQDHPFNDRRDVVDYPHCYKCDGPCRMPKDPVTCGHCLLTWDDAVVTDLTPAPSARCPFEYFHLYPEGT